MVARAPPCARAAAALCAALIAETTRPAAGTATTPTASFTATPVLAANGRMVVRRPLRTAAAAAAAVDAAATALPAATGCLARGAGSPWVRQPAQPAAALSVLLLWEQ